MEEEWQELKALVAQLKADNESLCQEHAMVMPDSGAVPSTPLAPPMVPSSAGSTVFNSVPLKEGLVFVPRNRKYHMFSGRSGIGLS